MSHTEQLFGRGGWHFGKPPGGAIGLNRDSHQSDKLLAWYTPLGNPAVGSFGLRSKADGYFFPLSNGNFPTLTTHSEIGLCFLYDSASSESFDENSVANFEMPVAWDNDNWTATAWIRIDDLTADRTIVGYGSGNNNNFRYWLLKADSGSSNWQFWAYDGSNTSISGGTAATGTIYHVAVVYTPGGSKIYVNGQEVASGSVNGPAQHSANQHREFRIGAEIWSTEGGFFDGLIGDVRVYHRALSAPEVYNLWAPQTRWELYRPVAPPRFWLLPQSTVAAPAAEAFMTTNRGYWGAP